MKSSLLQPRVLEDICNIYINPVLVPPLNWCDKNTMYQHAEVEVISSCHASGA